MASALIAYATRPQSVTVYAGTQAPGLQQITLTVTVGQGKGQDYTMKIDREILISDPPSTVLRIDCPSGPATTAEPNRTT